MTLWRDTNSLPQSLQHTCKEEWKNVDSGFSAINVQSEQMADTVGTSVSIPQIAGRQLF